MRSQHAHDIPLIVDEAHGAHFPFGAGHFPVSALQCGADLVIQSLHKTLPSLTQTALLHMQGNRVSWRRLEQCLQMYQSSSPSYVFMAAIEQCIFEMEQHGRQYMEEFAQRIFEVRKRLGRLQSLKLLSREEAGSYGVFDVDESKLVISCQNQMTGEELNECLRRDFAIEMEMCGADYAVAILTFLDSEEHLERLTEALLAIDRELERNKAGNCAASQIPKGEICMTPAEAANAPLERVRLEESAGRISGEFIYLYPPGIPIITPGERMNREIIGQVLKDRELGLPVQGLEDRKTEHLLVVKEKQSSLEDRNDLE